MDLKKKIISFLTDKKGYRENDQAEEEWLNDAGVVKLKHCTLGVRDPRVDREALESIEEVFFQDGSFDFVRLQLSSFNEFPDQQLIESVCASLKTQLQAVSRKISDLVLDNQTTYASELERVSTLQQDLQTTLLTCLSSRKHMRDAKENFTKAGLQMLANQRKRGLLKRLLFSLHTIKTLQRTDNKLKELLKEENFPGAINLSLEYQTAASTYKHYHCISELSSKLHDNSELVDEALDVALSRTCLSFNQHLYTRIQHAYRLLGKSQVAADQLHMHYISCVHVTSFNKVMQYVQGHSNLDEAVFQKKQFHDLCACLEGEMYVPCLVDLCGLLWRLVCNYRHSTQWHADHDNEEHFFERDASSSKINSDDRSNEAQKDDIPKDNKDNNVNSVNIDNTTNINTDNSNTNSISSTNNSSNNNKSNSNNSSSNLQHLDLSSIHYIRSKLQTGKLKLWTEIQQKVKSYLLSRDLSHFQYEEFMRVLDVINKLISIGREFCGSGSEALEEVLLRQSSHYFRQYHQTTLDETRIFIENEGWVLCPVKASFTLTSLQEFGFTKQQQTCNHKVDFFSTYSSQQNPFLPFDESYNEKNAGTRHKNHTKDFHGKGSEEEGDDRDENLDEEDEDDDVEESLKGDFVDEECRNGDDDDAGFSWNLTKAVQRQSSVVATRCTPLLTNLTLYICKLFGRYMNMMMSLECISYDVIKSMTQLIDYYFYAVHETFSYKQDNSRVSNKFRGVLERVRSSMGTPPLFHQPICNENNSPLDAVTGVRSSRNPFVPLKAVVIATESLMFLVSQFKGLETMLYEALPQQQRALLDQYLLQTLSVVPEVRFVVYGVFVRQVVKMTKVTTLMTSVTWDIDDIRSQHSAYVDVLLQEVGRFKNTLADFSRAFPLPKQALESLWTEVSLLCCETLLDGFAACKRCSNEGRALMMLDFQQFLLKFHKLSSLRPAPGQNLVEAYIKAFYLPEAEIEKWIVSCPEYNNKQLVSLLHCLTGLSRKSRHKLLSLVEEEKNKK